MNRKNLIQKKSSHKFSYSLLILKTFLSLVLLSQQAFSFFGDDDALFYETVSSEKECNNITGIWHLNKCWIKFSNFEIKKNEIEKKMDKEFQKIIETHITLEGTYLPTQNYPLGLTLISPQKKIITVLSVFNLKRQTLHLVLDKSKMKNQEEYTMIANAYLWEGNMLQPIRKKRKKIAQGEVVLSIQQKNSTFKGKGNLEYLDKRKRTEQLQKLKITNNQTPSLNYTNIDSRYQLPLSFVINDSLLRGGSTQLRIIGNKAYLRGEIGVRTYFQLKNLVNDYPKVKTLVLLDIPGSVYESIDTHLGDMIRKAGLQTEVIKESRVATGGIMLFIAGVNRIWKPGAKMGINVWCCINGKSAKNIPMEHPRHFYYSQYFSKMLGRKKGKEFYSFILQFTTSKTIYELSRKEIKKFSLAKIIP